MATEIKKQTLKEPAFACRLGDKFEKNSTFDTHSQLSYILVQDGKVIGATTGETEYGRKKVKLNKKFFPNLKCSFFSKTVNVEMFYIIHHRGYGYSKNQYLDIYGYFPQNTPAAKQYTISMHFRIDMCLIDPAKAYESFIVKTNSPYISENSMKKFFVDVGKSVLDEVAKNLSFAPDARYPSLTSESSLEYPEGKELFTKFKELYENTWKDFGYDVKVSLYRE